MRRGRGLFIAGGACAALALIVRLVLVGYGMTALCLLALALCLVFFGLMRRWGTRTAGVLSVLAGLFLAAAAGLFLWQDVPVFAQARSDGDTAADHAIVFGAAVHGDVPSLALTERLDAALAWQEAHPGARLVVSGGQGPGEDVAEAELMADWLVSHGVARERILIEDRAEDSWQNLTYSLALIERDGGVPPGRVALISSEYHLCRLRYYADALGCDAVCVAAHTTHPSMMVNYAVREGFALWKCRLFGIE